MSSSSPVTSTVSVSGGKRPRMSPEEGTLDTEEVLLTSPDEHGTVLMEDKEPSAKVARRPLGVSFDDFTSGQGFQDVAVSIPLAPTLKDYLAPGGIKRYRPRPEWYHYEYQEPEDETLEAIDNTRTSNTAGRFTLSSKHTVFGKDWDHALHVAIRENATECAFQLLDYGVPILVENAKGFTPLILAAQKGNLRLVRHLLHCGADPTATTLTGISCVLQASHFGRTEVLKLILQMANSSSMPPLVEIATQSLTTPLMRASQEGKIDCVRLLLQAGAQINRRNKAHLTALMLASQRGHASICQMLLDHGAEVDVVTPQSSTALFLACKRRQRSVVKVLVTAGCELSIRDPRGRTVRQLAQRREQTNLLELLDPAVQIDLMQRQGRKQRNWEMARIWHLLQKERADILVPSDSNDEREEGVGIHLIPAVLEQNTCQFPRVYTKSTTALMRTMTLPEPLVQNIAQFLPLPYLWEKRLGMLARRSAVNADDAVSGALDLMDEILEEGGLLVAFDEAQIPPPLLFTKWSDWKRWGRQKGRVAATTDCGTERLDVTTATCPPPRNLEQPTFCDLRRHAGFLEILSRRTPFLESTLTRPPFNTPIALLEKLGRVADVASLNRRMGNQGVNFTVEVAMDLVMLASQLCSWYWRERDEA